MKAMEKRLAALEGHGETITSPAIRQWLGMAITEAEEIALSNEPIIEADWDAIDTSDISTEFKAWLGIN